MSFEILFLFTLTTGLVCFTPGPAAMYVASVGTARSARLVAYAIAGIAVANALYFGLSAVGLASLLLASPKLYAAIRWVGAAYLIYLGFTLLFARGASHFEAKGTTESASGAKVFVRGFILELSNPKALLYFAALLPQFVTESVSLLVQMATYCAITVALDVCAYSFYGAMGFGAAHFSADWVLGAIRRSAGAVFIYAAARLALAV